MTKQPLPSKLIADIKRRLKEIQQKAAQATQKAGYAHDVISAGEPYWQALDSPFKSRQLDEVLTSGYAVLQSLHGQVHGWDAGTTEEKKLYEEMRRVARTVLLAMRSERDLMATLQEET